MGGLGLFVSVGVCFCMGWGISFGVGALGLTMFICYNVLFRGLFTPFFFLFLLIAAMLPQTLKRLVLHLGRGFFSVLGTCLECCLHESGFFLVCVIAWTG